MNGKITKICQECWREFVVWRYRRRTALYCSRVCFDASKVGKPSSSPETQFKKGESSWNKGKHWSDETKRKMGEARKGIPAWNKGTKGLVKPNKTSFVKGRMSGENHPMWIKYPSYMTLHKWVSVRLLSKFKVCQFCDTETRLHSANRSGEYLRDLKDYFALCPLCHKWYDHRYKGNKLIPLSKFRKLRLKYNRLIPLQLPFLS